MLLTGNPATHAQAADAASQKPRRAVAGLLSQIVIAAAEAHGDAGAVAGAGAYGGEEAVAAHRAAEEREVAAPE